MPSEPRVLALLAVLLALGAPLRSMYHLVDIVGSPQTFLAITLVTLLTATAIAGVVRPRVAVAIGAVVMVGGLSWYLMHIQTDPTPGALLSDILALLTGRSLLQINNVELWVLTISPAPVFLGWYFGVRRWYVAASVVAGCTLGFLVLTTDASSVTTLLGMVGVFAAIGFGNVEATSQSRQRKGTTERSQLTTTGRDPSDKKDGVDSGRRAVLEQLAAIVLVSAALSRAPSVGSMATSGNGQGDGSTLEGDLLSGDDSVTIQGSIRLSPEALYTVESEEERYWKVGSYDRYTGGGWIRTGERRPYQNDLTEPPGDSRSLRQQFTAESSIRTVPTAWKPIRYDGDTAVRVSRSGTLHPVEPLSAGDSYEVMSEVPTASAAELRENDGEYPPDIRETYTQLPESTPNRVSERTKTLTANAATTYETALVIERWLEVNKEYSLDVDRPDRNVADSFIFDMERGYCTYYATAMVTMLRTQNVPARFVVGYTPGQQVDERRRVVRGLDSHAWVEVYFPKIGWIQFDPTPANPRRRAERSRIEQARANGEQRVDTTASRPETPTSTPEGETPNSRIGTPTPTSSNSGSSAQSSTPRSPVRARETPMQPGGDGAGGDRNGGLKLPELPSLEETALGVVVLAGVAASLRRAELPKRISRRLGLRHQRRKDPATDVERAFQRAMHILEKQDRPREPGETVREYLDDVDGPDNVHRLAVVRERLRYAGIVTEETADEAVAIADGIVSEYQ